MAKTKKPNNHPKPVSQTNGQKVIKVTKQGQGYLPLILTAAVPLIATIVYFLLPHTPIDITHQDETYHYSHQLFPVHEAYALDPVRVLEIREENMKKYSYNYSRTGVDKRSGLTLQEYRDVYDGKWPVILTDIVPKWKASNWSEQFFYDNYRKERITIKAVDGTPDKGVSLAMPLELFMKHLNEGTPRVWTYLEDELFLPMRPQLQKDIGDYKYLEGDMFKFLPKEIQPWDSMLLWGTAYSRSTLHMDPYNWTGTNAVLQGLKKWKLFPPGQDHLLSVIAGRKSGFPLNCYKYNSAIDAFEPDLKKHPKFKQAKYLTLDQRPGELLLIPTGWFHQAYNAQKTMAISSQAWNINNYRVVLEEILKVGNLERKKIKKAWESLEPAELVKKVIAQLPRSIIDRGREVTEDVLRQLSSNGKET